MAYYLDIFKAYTYTRKDDRIKMRKGFALMRNEVMRYRLKLQRNLCFYCGAEITMKDHVDHLIPIMYGGLNRKSNFVASCKSCNQDKGTGQIEITNQRTIDDYLRYKAAYKKWVEDCKKNPIKKRYAPKRVILYGIYRADLFKEFKS